MVDQKNMADALAWMTEQGVEMVEFETPPNPIGRVCIVHEVVFTAKGVRRSGRKANLSCYDEW